MIKIRLARHEWYYDAGSPLGRPGGFGAVFAGGSAQEPVAIKRLHLDSNGAAHREMQLAAHLAGRTLKHVVPVLDAGEDSESGAYFVVMARAEGSLQDALNSRATYPEGEAAEILLQIASGLAEVENIAHRDLKPANVLYHEGVWKIADFGIARFVEESTSLATLKECLSPQYASPEQWQLERATPAADIYALGCIGYALLSGGPPFGGPSMPEYRQQHLFSSPPTLEQISPRLRSLLLMMLRKAPESRPSLDRLRAILEAVIREASGAPEASRFQSLVEVNAQVTATESEDERRRREEGALAAARKKTFDQAGLIMKEIAATLGQSIASAAPAARFDSSGVLSVSLGSTMLSMSTGEQVIYPTAFRQSRWDVVQGATIAVRQARPPYTWSSSLWYARLPRDTEYRWVEVSYFRAFSAESEAPYAITNAGEADSAAGPGMHTIQIAWGPQPVDDENLDQFCERWAALFAKGAGGRLSHPSRLPLVGEFWK